MQTPIPKKTKPPKRHKFQEAILITSSKLESVQAGKVYNTFKKGVESFFFDANAERVTLDGKLFQWEALDSVVMIVRIITSNWEGVRTDGIYRVYDDKANDERYVIDDNKEKVLFDNNIFKSEIV